MYMKDSLEKKLRKIFRKKQRENFWLGFKGDKYKLADELTFEAYRELERDLTFDELYELKVILEEYGKLEILLAIIPSDIWFGRCCSDLRLFDSFSDKQLEMILNDKWHNFSNLFFAQGMNRNRQHRIMHLLYEDGLENWIYRFTAENFSEFNRFLVWLYEKEKDEEYVSEQEKEAEVFQKISNISDLLIARLLQNTEAFVVKRILKQLNRLGRDIFSIYKKIEQDSLYNVLVKSDFALLNNAEEEVYSWLYSSLPVEEICIGIYTLLWEDKKSDFVKEVLEKRGFEKFGNFYESLSLTKKEEILECLLQDEEGRKVIEFLFEGEENLGLFENLIKEKYVTHE